MSVATSPIKFVQSPFIISLRERLQNQNSNRNSNSNRNRKKRREIAPLSGSEPKYSPELWNNDQIQFNHNCYAYVLNKINTGGTGKRRITCSISDAELGNWHAIYRS